MDDMLAAARKFNKTYSEPDNTEYSDMEAAARSFNKGGKQRYSITSERGWKDLPDSKGKESITTVDTQTGKRVKGRKVFGQFIPESSHVPLSEAPKPLKTTPGWRDALAAVGGGIYGAGLGLTQLGVEGLNKLSLGLNPALQRTAANLREKEADRRRVMNALAAEYKGEGWRNPIKRLGFEGEFLTTAAAPVGEAAQASSLVGKAAKGAAVGGAFGAAQPLTPEESRKQAALSGAAAGAVLTPTLGLAGKALKNVPGAAKGAYRRGSAALDRYLERKVNPEAAKLYSGAEGEITKNVRKVAPMSSADMPKTAKARTEALARDNEAIKDVVRLKDEIQLPDATGKAVSGRLPQTHQQLSEALDQGMKRVMDWTTEGLKLAGAEGKRIPVQPVINELSQVTLENGFSQKQVSQAASMIDEFSKMGDGFTPSAAVKRMAGLNNDIKSIFTGKNVSGDSPELLALAANKLRQSLNSTIDSLDALGPQFSDLRRSWGRMSAMQERTLRSLEQQANKEARGGMSVFDILSAEQVIQGLAKGRPEKVAEALGSYSVGKALKWLNSTDRAVKNMFKAADYMVGKERYKAPEFLPKATPTTPQAQKALPYNAPIEGEFTQVQPQLPPPAQQVVQPRLPAPQRALPESTAMPTGRTPGSTYANAPRQVQGMSNAEIAASQARIAEVKTKLKKTGAYAGLERFAAKQGVAVDEAALKLADLADQLGMDAEVLIKNVGKKKTYGGK